METWQLIALILLAVLVGATVPVLLRLYSTLGAVRQLVERTGPKIDRTLGELEQTVKRLNRTGTALEGGVKSLQGVFDAASDIGRVLQQFRDNVQTAATVAAALGPAIAAAARALTDYVKPLRSSSARTEAAATAKSPSEEDRADETAAPDAGTPSAEPAHSSANRGEEK
jgi:ABC-type transporter Mla subunit MlaD